MMELPGKGRDCIFMQSCAQLPREFMGPWANEECGAHNYITELVGFSM